MTTFQVDLTDSAKAAFVNQIGTQLAKEHSLEFSTCESSYHNCYLKKLEEWTEDVQVGFFRKKVEKEPHRNRINAVNIIESEKYYWVFTVESEDVKYDALARKFAELLAARFDVTLKLCNPESVLGQGSVNCQYCGERTGNLEKCVHCGGKPI